MKKNYFRYFLKPQLNVQEIFLNRLDRLQTWRRARILHLKHCISNIFQYILRYSFSSNFTKSENIHLHTTVFELKISWKWLFYSCAHLRICKFALSHHIRYFDMGHISSTGKKC